MSEKILIALTDKSLVSSLLPKMKEAGYVYDVASNSKDVISKIRISKPDLMVIDMNLPVEDNVDLFTSEYVHKDVAKIPTIIVSSSGDPIQMNKVPATPTIKDYIIRFHIEPSEVIRKIERAFGRELKNEPINETPKKTASNGKTIMWVEDDKLLGNILSKKLEASGYRLLKVTTGKEAVQMIDVEIPNIIILDIMLPEMSGFDILQAIRSRDHLKSVPVIMLSNLSRQVDIEKANSLGANNFLVKAAVSIDEIIREVENLMKKTGK